jgi:hypothetical protein
MQWSGIAHVFIYRDLRDVAVSQAHHIMNPDEVRFTHVAKKVYSYLGGFDEILAAVIEGMGPFAGICERWGEYNGWRHSECTLCVRYSDFIDDPKQVATDVLDHGIRKVEMLGRLAFRVDETLYNKAIENMVAIATNRSLSPTFRKGKVGGWEEEFTEAHKDLFKKHDTEGWLIKLGFEEDNDW